MADDLFPGELPTDEPIDLDVQPEPEPEAAPEPEAVAAPEPEAAPEEPRKVDLGALHEERAKRRELEARLEAQEARFQAFQERLKTPEPPAPELPAFDEDPASNLDARLKAQEEMVNQTAESLRQQQEAQVQQAQLGQFQQEFYAKEAQFAQQTPDYYEAVNWLRGQRAQELTHLGYQPAQVQQMVDQEAVSYAITATNNGVDPVSMFYETAKSRGYSPATKEPDPAVLAAKQQKAATVGPSGRGAGTDDISLSDLANMSDEDFDRYTSGDKWANLW